MTYIWSSALWALAGLLVGYFIGRAGREVVITETSTARRTSVGDNVIGVVVILLAIVTVMGLAFQASEAKRAMQCQTEFNIQFMRSIQERQESAATERQAQRELLTAIVAPGRSGGGAIQRYIDSLNAADAQRTANPYPIQPDCGA